MRVGVVHYMVNKWFQQNFQNWTSGNHDIDELIQGTQLKAKY